jgi:hypothetical protein
VQHIRKRPAAAIVSLALAAGALGNAALAAGTTPAKPPTERITLFSATARGHDLPIAVEATGPIHGIGTETQTETPTPSGQINHATLHLPDGTIQLQAPEKFAWQPDQHACAAKAHGGGTFKITGGTGIYRNATGNGTFTDRGVLIGARSRAGKCLGRNAPPTAIYVTATLTGQAAPHP